MTRLQNWQTELQYFLDAKHEAPFKYGHWDCCLMVCDAILAMTGVDVATAFRDKYSTRKEAYAALKEYAGTASVRAIAWRITNENNMQAVTPLMAQRGDVALIRRGERDFSLGIIGLNGTEIIALQAKGLFRVPLNLAVQCWRV